jgi:lipocalin
MNFKKVFSVVLSFVVSVSAQDFSQPLDIDAYLGKWNQIYSDNFVQSTFEKGAKCVFSVYGLNGNNNISVYNQQLDSNIQKQSIDGYAYIPDEKYPRKLAVTLDGGMNGAPYWIYSLGPIVEDQYQYAIVSDQFKLSLFVLVRDVQNFLKEYNDIVLEELKELGFVHTRNKPILTDQQNC